MLNKLTQFIFVIAAFILFFTCSQSVAENLDYLINETKKNPKSAVAYNKLGLAYSKIGNYKKAIREYEKALKIAPNSPLVYNNIGSAFHQMRLFKEAIGKYKKGLEIMPESHQILNNLELLLYSIYPFVLDLFAEYLDTSHLYRLAQ